MVGPKNRPAIKQKTTPKQKLGVQRKRRAKNRKMISRTGVAIDGSKVLGAFAGAITLPSSCKPFRFPTATIDTNQTAIWHLTKTIPMDYSTYSSNQQVVMLTHCPLMPVWGTAAAGTLRSYHWHPDTYESYANLLTASIPLKMAKMVDANPVKIYPLRDSHGKFWVYVPATAEWGITLTGFGTSQTGVVYYSVMTVMGETRSSSCTVNGYLALPDPPVGQWASIDRIVTSGTTITAPNANVIISYTNAQPYFQPLLNLPVSTTTLSKPLESMRVNAAGALVMNTSAPLYKNGTVQGARLNWLDIDVFDPPAAVSAIGSVNEALRFSGKASTGAYSFMIPTQASITFSDYTYLYYTQNVDGETYTDTMGFCGTLEDYKNINFIAFNVDATTTSKFVMQMQYDVHLEGQTNEATWDLGVPLLPYNDFSVVVTAAAKMVPFTENPLHTALLALGVKVLKQITPYFVPYAHNAVDMLAGRIARL